MVTLQRFKLLVMQCVTARSSSRSPTTAAASCFHFRRGKAVRELLRGYSFRRLLRRRGPSGGSPADLGEKKGLISHTLKDLFVSSPPPPSDGAGGGDEGCRLCLDTGGEERGFGLEGFAAGRGGGAPRFGSVGRRYRLLRRGSLQVLLTIPE